ncbi:Flp pilus assembly protein CpaB [Sphingomonas sp.]|uniref:Flp pilus assembly protein CpaB n=1 Tax=Sphingomonas sp. TaxID=28214 RepID=UPI002CEBC0F5|nr:Flp pilus assembly protein CpaB [Sphingomonas sp.]HWK36508.1 Flp pilus assembly protein CpaB [Sphingomonas sp.]
MDFRGGGKPGGTVLIALGAILGLGLVIFGAMRLGAPARVETAAGDRADQRLSRLVTAARPIGRGQLIQAADLKSTLVVGAPPSYSIVSPTQAIGRVATADIQPQQLILNSLISSDPSAAGLAMLVPVGQRVISIDTTDEIAVGGFLRPGDIVDIATVLPGEAFGSGDGPDRSEAQTLLQNIKVMTVGPTLGEAPPAQSDAGARPVTEKRALTLAMLPEQLGVFTLARKMGRFYLVLRNPADEAVVPIGRTVLAGLRGGEPAPRAAAAAPPSYAPRRSVAAPRPVELIVGGQRQIIYPGKGR